MAHLKMHGDKRRTSHRVVIPTIATGHMTDIISVRLQYPVDRFSAAQLDMTSQEAQRLVDALTVAINRKATFLLVDDKEEC